MSPGAPTQQSACDIRRSAQWVLLALAAGAVLNFGIAYAFGWKAVMAVSTLSCILSLAGLSMLHRPRTALLLAMAGVNLACCYSAYLDGGLSNVAISVLPVIVVVSSLMLDSVLLAAATGMTAAAAGAVVILRFTAGGIPFKPDVAGHLCSLLVTLVLAGVIGHVLAHKIKVGAKRTASSECRLRVTADALRVSEERWQLALRGSNDGIFDWNIATGETYFSDRWKTMLGYHPSEITNSTARWRSLVHPDDRDRVVALVAEHLRGQTEFYEAEYRMLARDGTFRWILARGRALWDPSGRPIRMVGSHSDITARHVHQEQLREATTQAEAASRAKSEFLANMSHELRTPMNAVLGIAGLLPTVTSEEERTQYLDLLTASARSLMELLTQVLDLSRIEAGRLELEEQPFSLSECLELAAGPVSVAARQKNVSIQTSIDPRLPDTVSGDALRLRQIFINLIGNAVKFTPSGSVTVTVEQDTRPDDSDSVWVHASIRDEGIGIPAAKLSEIFEPFRQGDESTTRRFGGTGLGLTISKLLVSAMDGKIWAESEEGAGSTFHFTARFRRCRSRLDVRKPLSPENPARPLNVLLVEDNPVNQKVAARLLELARHSVTIAGDGREAIEMVRQKRFDVIFMDMHMPRMNGLAATQEIRRMERMMGVRTPIWALTASAMEEDRRRCLDAGMDGFLTKPIQREELLGVTLAV